MKTKLILSGLLLTLVGCTAVKYNGPEVLNTRVSYPPAGVAKVAHVGQDLLEQGTVAQEEILVVSQDIDISPYTIEATTYKQMGYDRHHNFFLPYGVTQAPSAETPQALRVEKKAGGDLCIITTKNAKHCVESNNVQGAYTEKKVASDRGVNFIKVLIYKGLKDNKILVSYREYLDTTARAAYSDDIAYDLSASHVIDYKGAKIEVEKADKNQIQYKVIQHFSN